MTTATIEGSGAALSACSRYRYALWRCWNSAAPELTFVMLNPSTADAMRNDATIRRCIGFAKRLEYGGIRVVNLFAYRCTDPRALWLALRKGVDIVGPENDRFVRAAVATRTVVCAWGRTAERPPSIEARITRLRNDAWRTGGTLRCLGILAAGDPAHPVRLPYVPLQPWPAAEKPFGHCGSCNHPLYGPVATRHHGHCGSCGALVFGNPPVCALCGQSFAHVKAKEEERP